MLTLTSYDVWRWTHAIDHATTGNLESRGIGDISTLTAQEYLTLSKWRQLRYRLYRNPIVMFGLGLAYLFFVQHRLPPIALMRCGLQPWLSTMVANAAIALVVRAMMWLSGFAVLWFMAWVVLGVSCNRDAAAGCSARSNRLGAQTPRDRYDGLLLGQYRCASRATREESRRGHCPKCQDRQALAWMEQRTAELLEVPDFHIVFTLPAEMGAIAYHNKAVIYDLNSETMLTIAVVVGIPCRV